MATTVSLIGIEAVELKMIRMLINLLRHDDPFIPVLASQSLLYLADTANKRTHDQDRWRDRIGLKKFSVSGGTLSDFLWYDRTHEGRVLFWAFRFSPYPSTGLQFRSPFSIRASYGPNRA